MPEEYKIDYTGIQIPDIEAIKRTSQQFTNWRRSMGFQTEEEKLKEAQERASAAWAELGNSEDVYDWYNALQPDPRKQAKFREDGAKTAGWLMTIPMTIASAGTMGWVPALTTTATGIAGGYGGYKAGEYLDNKLDTKWLAPTLGFAGGMFGGGLGYKGLVKAGNAGLLGTSPYTHLLNGKQNLVYGSQFTKDVVDDVAKSTLNKLKTNGPLRHYLTTRMTPKGSNTELYETHLYDTLTGKDLGQISTSNFKNQPSSVEQIIGTPLAKGKGRDLYSASWLKNPNGVKSGERLVSPHQTIPTWKHFDYDVLGYYGSHGAAETGGKVVRLKYPERLLPEDAPKIIEHTLIR